MSLRRPVHRCASGARAQHSQSCKQPSHSVHWHTFSARHTRVESRPAYFRIDVASFRWHARYTLNSAMAYQEKQLQEISKKFQIYGEILHAETLKIGHINETYSATYSQGGTRVRYIHQKINRNVFKNPGAVMKNVVRVTSHLRRKLEAQNARHLTRRSLNVIPTRDGNSYFLDADE